MARELRTHRQPAGPGRTPRRPRTATSPASASVRPAPAPVTEPVSSGSTRAPRRLPNLGVTRRAFVFLSVLLVLGLSYAGSLRVWLMQSQELRTAQVQIEERTARVGTLEAELARWNDDAYVEAQARTRLGWVMPGEVGYRVLGPDGTVLSGSEEIEGVGVRHTTGLESRWWDDLAGSFVVADTPPAQPR